MKAMGTRVRSSINWTPKTAILLYVPLYISIPIDAEFRATNGETDYHLGYADVPPEIVVCMTLLCNSVPSPCSPDA